MNDLLAITNALADEGRVRALAALFSGELCACQIIELLGLAPSTVSKHMAILRHAGLIESRKDGRWMYYRLAGEGSPRVAAEMLRWLRGELPRQDSIQADAARLRGIVAIEPEALCEMQRGRSQCCPPAQGARGGDKTKPINNKERYAMTTTPAGVDSVREKVREGYGKIATSGSSCCGSGGCCGPSTVDAGTLAKQIGYTEKELANIPAESNLGLSCGNPGAIASLSPGEVVLDLGSGAGFDVFLAGPKVGPTGRAIGVDMTAEMLGRARRSAEEYRKRTGLDNVEFRMGEIESLPVADASVDVVISNCVINLSPDKPRVWREIARVLKPGGRVAVSDLALLRPLPEPVVSMVEALIGCVAGASLVSDIERQMRDAGLRDIKLTSKPEYIDAMTSFNDPLYKQVVDHLPPGTKASDYITSLDIAAKR